MSRIIGLFCCALGVATPAAAQVINGEGTYEGSSMHQPPDPPPVASRGQTPTRTTNPPAGSPRDVPESHD